MTPVQMPYKYAVEMLCDFIGAGKAYYGEEFTYNKEYDWWKNKRNVVVMHPQTKCFIENMLVDLMVRGEKALNKTNLKKKYHGSKK